MAHGSDSPEARAGAKLRALRKSRRVRLVDVARHAGMDVSLVAKVERGVTATTLERYELLAESVGTTLSNLFRRTAA